uniref:Protein kinase domain-containing protein n=1 Tax=Panagrellus redivivus TaxID=6233 RepID=A0A7E5A1I1_PANRE
MDPNGNQVYPFWAYHENGQFPPAQLLYAPVSYANGVDPQALLWQQHDETFDSMNTTGINNFTAVPPFVMPSEGSFPQMPPSYQNQVPVSGGLASQSQTSINSSPAKPVKPWLEAIKLASELARMVPDDHVPLTHIIEHRYIRLKQIGKGTYGEVSKARCKETGAIVALKKIRMVDEEEGIPITALREIELLTPMRHPNIIELVDTGMSKERGKSVFYMVFNFCDHDLAGILANKDVKISPVDTKTMLHHLFLGLAYIHSKDILHRDLKPANVLISKDGYLKLADFGCGRLRWNGTSGPCYTNRVGTILYKAPELLLGEQTYGGEVDIWAAGCMMIEFWTRNPLFQGRSDQEQLQKICKLCGSVDETTMQRVHQLSNYTFFNPAFFEGVRQVQRKLKPVMKDESTVDLIDQIFILEPTLRPTAAEALEHPYFSEKPLPKWNIAYFVKALEGKSMLEMTSGVGSHGVPGHGSIQPLKKEVTIEDLLEFAF